MHNTFLYSPYSELALRILWHICREGTVVSRVHRHIHFQTDESGEELKLRILWHICGEGTVVSCVHRLGTSISREREREREKERERQLKLENFILQGI